MNVSTVTIDVGGQCEGYFDIFSSEILLSPLNFSFASVSEQLVKAEVLSSIETIVGLTPNCPYTLVSENALLDAGSSAASLTGVYKPSKRVISSPTGTLVVQLKVTSDKGWL